jgi:hypothetical protein
MTLDELLAVLEGRYGLDRLDSIAQLTNVELEEALALIANYRRRHAH